MAKKSTQNVEKLSAEELNQLQSLQGMMANALNNLANIEIAKYEILQDYAAMKVKMQELTQELQAKYGEVNILLADGTISKIEEVPGPQLEVVQ